MEERTKRYIERRFDLAIEKKLSNIGLCKELISYKPRENVTLDIDAENDVLSLSFSKKSIIYEYTDEYDEEERTPMELFIDDAFCEGDVSWLIETIIGFGEFDADLTMDALVEKEQREGCFSFIKESKDSISITVELKRDETSLEEYFELPLDELKKLVAEEKNRISNLDTSEVMRRMNNLNTRHNRDKKPASYARYVVDRIELSDRIAHLEGYDADYPLPEKKLIALLGAE